MASLINQLTQIFQKISNKIEAVDRRFPDRRTKQRIGEKIIDRIRDKVARGESPVRHFGNFEPYTAKYAARKGVSVNDVDLELSEDMLNALEANVVRGGIEIGIFDPEQAEKAETHNAGTQAGRGIPARPFIPIGSNRFKPEILDGIEREVAQDLEDELDDEFRNF